MKLSLYDKNKGLNTPLLHFPQERTSGIDLSSCYNESKSEIVRIHCLEDGNRGDEQDWEERKSNDRDGRRDESSFLRQECINECIYDSVYTVRCPLDSRRITGKTLNNAK